MNKLNDVTKRGLAWIWTKVGHVFGDEAYLKVRFRLLMGKRLNLEDPQTFSEKLQWLKLYNRRPEYTMMVDKYAVKDYVSGIIGNEYVIPTLGIWDRPEDIDWEALPSRFVLKTTHGGGSNGVVICKDKNSFDREAAIKLLKKNMKQSDWKIGMEWPYKDVPHRIIAEEFVDPAPDIKDLADYKFFCFDGEVKGLFVATERQKEGVDVKFDFFDADYNHLPFKQGHENANPYPPKPHNFEQMKEVAAKLSKGHPHVRVDLYDVGDRVLFGEITMFHFGGMVPFRPEEWDKMFGDMLTLPGERLGGVLIRFADKGEMVITQPCLADYKWYCFDGEPHFCQVIQGRTSEETIDFFDKDWNHQEFIGLHPTADNAPTSPEKPVKLQKQIEIARALSKNNPFTRIDLYEVKGKVLFGEITLYPLSGMGSFRPDNYNLKVGQLLKLPAVS